MAQVRFYGMSFDFSYVRTWYPDSNFAAFILQPEMIDSNKWRDEFILIAYPVDETGKKIGNEIILSTDKNEIFKVKDKLNLGNIPFSKAKLEKYVIADQPGNKIDSLFFTPRQYFDYVGYTVTERPPQGTSEIVDETVLNPSPPADPE